MTSSQNNKMRLDQLLLELGYFDSREKARTVIMSNAVTIAGKLFNKAGEQINTKKFYEALESNADHIKVEDKFSKYVSRGAYKLEKAYKEFNLDFSDALVIDIGASTGGFSDFALQHGASKIIAIDVGRAQLAYKLQQDTRVLNLEGVNIRDFDVSSLEEYASKFTSYFIVSDLSFISLTKVVDKFIEIVSLFEGLKIVLLIKPQFEAGKKIADKFRGVISDEQVRKQILDQTLEELQNQGLKLEALEESPIKGAKGNVEYLALFTL